MLISDYSHTPLYMESVPPGRQGLISVMARTAVGQPTGCFFFLFVRFFSVNQSAVAKLRGTCPLWRLINSDAYKRGKK